LNLTRGLLNVLTVLQALPSSGERAVLGDAWRIERSLPGRFAAQPLPELMKRLDAEVDACPSSLEASAARKLADAAVELDYFSPLGLCLRRSLVRYVLLRQAGLPVAVQFGAKKDTTAGRSRIAGHAWLTLHGQPYAEDPRDYAGFAPIYRYPPSSALDYGSG
jgi:hypothetical protein